jgi:hypothetical protein
VRLHIGLAAAAFFALAIAQTWPLSLHLADRIPHDLGDPVLVAYVVNWNARVPPLGEAWWHPPFFWPTRNAITLSEPFLGVAPLAWLLHTCGASPAVIYNLLFIAAFWLSPLAMYMLVHALTRDPVAAFVAGLAFGFAPFRASHLPHLQLLLVPGVPLMFFALHRAATAVPWAGTAAAAWLWQGLTGLYFLLMLPVAAALWLVWFAGRNWRLWLRTTSAFLVALALAAVVVLPYRAHHQAENYLRPYDEVRFFSADVTALAQSTADLKFRLTGDEGNRPEQDLFPGFAITLLALTAFTSIPLSSGRLRLVTAAFLALAAAAAIVATIALVRPSVFTIGPIPISIRSAHKALAVVWVSLLIALSTTRTITSHWNERSLAIGYAGIALVFWVLALGPDPSFNGTLIWYRAPYWFLYEYVPGFEGLRVPARFWAIVTACLAVLAGLGAHQWARSRWGRAAVVAAAVVLVVEGWTAPLHLEPAPTVTPLPAGAETVLEIPAGNAYADSVAMYRSLWHGQPVLNGSSGYTPESYQLLIEKIKAGDAAAVAVAAHGTRLAVVFNDPSGPSTPLYKAIVSRAERCERAAAAVICVLPPAPRQ